MSLIKEKEACFGEATKFKIEFEKGGLCFLISYIFRFSVPEQVVNIQTNIIDSKFQLLSECYFGVEFVMNFLLEFQFLFRYSVR